MSVTPDDWLIVEWPHSAALGSRWFAYPPKIPSEKPRPPLKAFPSLEAARCHAAAMIQEFDL